MTTMILFVCSRNAGRSQMAEGIAQTLLPGTCQIFSAGERPSVLSAMAVRVMSEKCVDISRQHSKGLPDLPFREYDVLVVLGEWKDPSSLPTAPRVKRETIPDPAGMKGGEAEVLDRFREIRDVLYDRISSWDREGLFLPEQGEIWGRGVCGR
ncbi:MAG: hypothetical protein MUC66_07880 [Methanolinea sp.]|jgi:arsenate reductase|nr:hypothetical protein [Methanolinea sp.]